MKYLHETAPGIFWLDHKLVPEVRAMLAAQSSRAPVGGVRARYAQVVDAVAESNWDGPLTSKIATGNKVLYDVSWKDAVALHHDDADLQEIHEGHLNDARRLAEDRLCEYPIHPRVQKFFDDFVGKYGHSSILELTGGVSVFSEGVSWLTAWLLFDSPLCAGQEFSTRAVQHKDWPMARECNLSVEDAYVLLHGEERGRSLKDARRGVNPPGTNGCEWIQPEFQQRFEGYWRNTPHPNLVALHNAWFEVFEAEVAWWKEHLSVEANRLALGIGDKEPFRPALDRARWALPGTIATGCAHTSNLRERARVIRDGSLLAQASHAPAAEQVWRDLAEAYRQALPGLAGMGLREAVYNPEGSNIPGHLAAILSTAPDGPDVEVAVHSTGVVSDLQPFKHATGGLADVQPFKRTGEKSYLDPAANTVSRVDVAFRCSLAVARDWRRHRSMYPWHLQVVRDSAGLLQIDHHYAPMSDLAKERLPALLQRSTEVFNTFMSTGNTMQAGLALPLGARVRVRGQGGLRDVVYTNELRANAPGKNFEYAEQAETALELLISQIPFEICEAYGIGPV